VNTLLRTTNGPHARDLSLEASGYGLSNARGSENRRGLTARLSRRCEAFSDDARVRTVTLVEAPTSAGAYAPGQEEGPRALLDAGMIEELVAAGVTVRHRGTGEAVSLAAGPPQPAGSERRGSHWPGG
jgi:hypothetical protein